VDILIVNQEQDGHAMNLTNLVSRTRAPAPWSEGDNIPWHEPGFSRRMLQEHLSQAHDAASRRLEIIDRHVGWIHHEVLAERPAKILDLGCGPGLYSSRLARLGHTCAGIDYSPASIEYARAEAARQDLACTYRLHDIRTAEYGSGYGLAMLIYGEFNVFRPADARRILAQAYGALAGGGLLLLEAHTFSAVQNLGEDPSVWYSAESGLFAAEPHLCLQESYWDAAHNTATIRYYVVDAASATVTRYAQSMQAYTEQDYSSLLASSGFEGTRFFPSLTGQASSPPADFWVIVAQKPAGAA
jgi:SAM-dependent methyltransferase